VVNDIQDQTFLKSQQQTKSKSTQTRDIFGDEKHGCQHTLQETNNLHAFINYIKFLLL
jgi:glucuronate isomerase